MNTIKKGSSGQDVLTLNSLLLTDQFTAVTEAAVKAFQSQRGLTADGIVGPKTWAALQNPAPVPTPGNFKQPPDFKQYDSKWATKMYSNHGDKSQTMKSSACGPSAMADVVAALKDPSVMPPVLADLAMKWGDRTYSDGTAWSFFDHIQKEYGFSKKVKSTSLATLKQCIDEGGYVVCSMGPGYWTKGGHYICAWKYADGYIYCNDPASSTRKRQKESEFSKERKAYFCFWK